MPTTTYNLDLKPFQSGWMDAVKMNSAAIDYDTKYVQHMEDLKNMFEGRQVRDFLSTIPANQAMAGEAGEDMPTFYAKQQKYILEDPNFQRFAPSTQAEILSRVRQAAQGEVNNMFTRGELEGARKLANAMGLTTPSNPWMEAIQAGNPEAVNQQLAAMNSQYAGPPTLNDGTAAPASVWVPAMAQNPRQAGANALAATGVYQQQQDEKDERDKQRQAQLAVLMTQFSGNPGMQGVVQMLAKQYGIDLPETPALPTAGAAGALNAPDAPTGAVDPAFSPASPAAPTPAPATATSNGFTYTLTPDAQKAVQEARDTKAIEQRAIEDVVKRLQKEENPNTAALLRGMLDESDKAIEAAGAKEREVIRAKYIELITKRNKLYMQLRRVDSGVFSTPSKEAQQKAIISQLEDVEKELEAVGNDLPWYSKLFPY